MIFIIKEYMTIGDWLELRFNDRLSGIYKIQYQDKVYIGQTRNKKNRFNKYKSNHCEGQQKLYNHLNKYGVDNFSFDMMVDLHPDLPQSEFDRMEQEFIDLFRDMGYEMLNIREGGSRGKISEETKKKLSDNMRGKYVGDKNPFFGRTHSEETRQIIREYFIGKPSHNLGKPMSDEQKKKLSEFRKGMKLSEETKLKLSKKLSGENNPNYGKPMSIEQKNKISDSKKGSPAPNRKLVLNMETGIFYNSCTEAAKVIGISYKYMSDMLNGKRRNKTSFRYV